METETGKLFVGGISWETSEDRLRNYFQNFGEVTEAVIMKDRSSGRARGFGFVVFSDATVAERVLRERHVIDGRIVEAKKAVPMRDDHQSFINQRGSPGPTTRTKKIFVGGLPSSITEAHFKGYFDQFGEITDAVVMYDHSTQRPRGFGFVTYHTEESVDKVLVKNFHELHGKMVEVKRAVPKELSPGPARGYAMNRPNGLLHNNGFAPQGLGPVSPGRYSPLRNDRGGFSPYGLGFLNDGNGGDSYSYFGGSPSRFGSPMSIGNGRSISFVNGNLWGNPNLNYITKSPVSNSYYTSPSRTENHRLPSNLGIIGEETRDRPKNGGDIFYSQNNFGSRQVGGNVGRSSLYRFGSGARDEPRVEDLYGGDSYFAGYYPWKSLPNELDLSANLASKNPAGFVGDYSVIAR